MSTSYDSSVANSTGTISSEQLVNTFIAAEMPADVVAAISAIVGESTTVEITSTAPVNLSTDPNASIATVLADAGVTSSTETAATVITGPTEAPTTPAQIANWTFTDSSLNTGAIILGPHTAANVTFGADSPVQVMTVGGLGGSTVKFDEASTVGRTVTLQGGEGDSVQTGAGNDTITFDGGNNVSINTGEGDDIVKIGGAPDQTFTGLQITSGAGNSTFQLSSDIGVTATIDGGAGFDNLSTIGLRSQHSFTFDEYGKLHMHSEGDLTLDNMSVITYISTDQGFDTDLSYTNGEVTVIASDEIDSLAGRLYRLARGASPLDSTEDGATDALEGINYWMEQYEGTDPAQMAKAFLASDEFNNGATDAARNYFGTDSSYTPLEFVQHVFENYNAFADDVHQVDLATGTIDGLTAEQYADKILSGELSRADVMYQIAASDDAVTAMGIDGSQYVIEDFNDQERKRDGGVRRSHVPALQNG